VEVLLVGVCRAPTPDFDQGVVARLIGRVFPDSLFHVLSCALSLRFSAWAFLALQQSIKVLDEV
jgi:hypothetical protein